MSSTHPSLPEWYTRHILDPIKHGRERIFLLHGDVNGLVPNPEADTEPDRPYIGVSVFMEKVFGARDQVYFYSRAQRFRILRERGPRALFTQELINLQYPHSRAKPKPSHDELTSVNLDLQIITCALQEPHKNIAIIVTDVHELAPADHGERSPTRDEELARQQLKHLVQHSDIGKNALVLLTPSLSRLHSELRAPTQTMRTVFIPRPTREERAAYCAAAFHDPIVPVAEQASFLDVTERLNLVQLYHLVQTGAPRTVTEAHRLADLALNAEYSDVLDVLDTSRSFSDIGGYETIKQRLRDIAKALHEHSSSLPLGLLLMGQPGTGKTALVEALAREANARLVRPKPWQGPSPRDAYRQDRLLESLRELAPAVVICDPINLAFDMEGREYMLTRMHELTTEPAMRGQLLLVTCVNSLEQLQKIDPAFLRCGRHDERIFIPLPDAQDRAAILDVSFRRHEVKTQINDFTSFGRQIDEITGADLEKAVLESRRYANGREHVAVWVRDLGEALDSLIMRAPTPETDAFTLRALLESSSRPLLPRDCQRLIRKIFDRHPKLSDPYLHGLTEQGLYR